MTTPMHENQFSAIASAPEWSLLYDRDSALLLQATALPSFRNSINTPTTSEKPQLIHIASSNVLVDNSNGYPLSVARHSQAATPTASAPIRVSATPEEPVPATDQDIGNAVAIGPRFFRGRPVKAKDADLPDSILAYKRRRQAGTAVVAWMGGFTGLVLLGPYGAAVGGGVAYSVSKSIGKARERRLIRNYQMQS